MSFYLIILFFVLAPLAASDARPHRYAAPRYPTPAVGENGKFYMCVAECGKQFVNVTERTLLSREKVAERRISDEDLKKCFAICKLGAGFPKNSDAFHQHDLLHFEKLRLVCADSYFPEGKVHVKFDAREPNSNHGNEATLRVIEVWMSTIFENGEIVKTLVFSPIFELDYKFTHNQHKELFSVRTFAFNNEGMVGFPLCSNEMPIDAFFNNRHDAIILKLDTLKGEGNKTEASIEWQALDSRYPPECQQFVTWTSADFVESKRMELDASHRFILNLQANPRSEPENAHVLTVHSRTESVFGAPRQAVLTLDYHVEDRKQREKPHHEKLSIVVDLLPIFTLIVVVALMSATLVICYYIRWRYVPTKMERFENLRQIYIHNPKVITEVVTPIKRHGGRFPFRPHGMIQRIPPEEITIGALTDSTNDVFTPSIDDDSPFRSRHGHLKGIPPPDQAQSAPGGFFRSMK